MTSELRPAGGHEQVLGTASTKPGGLLWLCGGRGGDRHKRWKAPLESGLGPLTQVRRGKLRQKDVAGPSFSNPSVHSGLAVMPLDVVGWAGPPSVLGTPGMAPQPDLPVILRKTRNLHFL